MTVSGSVTVTGIDNTAGLIVGDPVTGPGIPTGTTLLAILSSTSVTLSQAATLSSQTPVQLTFGGNTLVGGLGIDNLQAGAGADTLYASYDAASWSQGEAAAAAIGVHIVPPQLFQGDTTASQLQALLQAQQSGPLTTAQQNQLIALLTTEFNALTAEESSLNTQVSNFLAIPNLSQNPTLKSQLIAVATQDEFVQTETTALLNQILNALGAAGFQEDRLIGGSGSDRFYGNIQGATWMGGGSGNQTFYNYNTSDTIQGNATGVNTLVLQDYQGNNAITLSQSANAVDFSINSGTPVVVGDTGGKVSDIQVLEVQLGSGNDFVSIDPSLATMPSGFTGLSILAGTGNDTVNASAFTGNETLTGGAGKDVIEVEAPPGATSIWTGTSTTELDLEDTGSYAVTLGKLSSPAVPVGLQIGPWVESITQLGSFGKLVVVGGAGSNTFTTDGSIPDEELDGGTGSNVFNVSGGTVKLVGGSGTNSFNITGPGNYTVIGAGTAAPATPAGPGVTAPLPESSTITISHTTATLSQARGYLAATTVGNMALFAGGYSASGYSSVVDIYNSVTGQWSTASLSQARDRLSAATVGSLALFAGGYSASGYSSVVDIYNSVTGQWSTASLSQARDGMAVATVGTKVFFAGGQGVSGYSSVVDIYDASTGQWSTASLSQGRYFPAATSVGTKVLFAGGLTATATSNVVDIYDTSTGQWSTASLSQARYALAATTAGNEAFFAGGATGLSSGYSSVVDIYNATTGQWSTASLSWSRVVLAATLVGSKAFFAGGFSGSYDYQVDIYDTETGQWSTSESLSQSEGYLAGTSVGTKAIFAGGVTGSGTTYSNTVDIYDTAPQPFGSELPAATENPASTAVGTKAFFTADASQEVDIYDASTGQWSTHSLSQPRYNMAATTVGTQAIFAGGLGSAAVDIYNASTGQWSTASLSQARGYLAATTVGGEALFAGGEAANGPTSTVDIYDAATGQWSTASLSQARYDLAAAATGTLAFFAGGATASGPTSTVDIYDAATGQWSTASLSQARSDLAATTAGTKVFFAGGEAASGPTNVVDIYDASTGQWSTASLSQARYGLAATTVGNEVFFAGGDTVSGPTGSGPTNVVDIYNTVTGQWSTTTLNEVGAWLGATTVGPMAIFSGAFVGFTSYADSFFAPAIVSNITSSGTSDGITTIGYTLTGSTDATGGASVAGIQVQYSVNGGPWQVATAASGGDGTSGLTADVGGTANTFLWDSLHDLGNTINPSVQVRITPSDYFGIGVTQASARSRSITRA